MDESNTYFFSHFLFALSLSQSVNGKILKITSDKSLLRGTFMSSHSFLFFSYSYCFLEQTLGKVPVLLLPNIMEVASQFFKIFLTSDECFGCKFTNQGKFLHSPLSSLSDSNKPFFVQFERAFFLFSCKL